MHPTTQSPHYSLRSVILNYEAARKVLTDAGYEVGTETMVGRSGERVIGLSIFCDGITIGKHTRKIKELLPAYQISSRNETIYIR